MKSLLQLVELVILLPVWLILASIVVISESIDRSAQQQPSYRVRKFNGFAPDTSDLSHATPIASNQSSEPIEVISFSRTLDASTGIEVNANSQVTRAGAYAEEEDLCVASR